jgi:soluble lytic murein transglycosylase-like protein
MNAREQQLLFLLGLAGVAYWWSNRQTATSADPNAPPPSDATSFFSNPVASVIETVTPWYTANSASNWLPALNAAEDQHGIPTNLLARLAYQESHFREEIIRGTKVSSAGAMGMMQMMPQYFPIVNQPTPYTDQNVLDQIDAAAQYLVSLYHQLGSWSLALAGYNAGAAAVKKYGGIPPYPETQNYVAQITADVPVVA